MKSGLFLLFRIRVDGSWMLIEGTDAVTMEVAPGSGVLDDGIAEGNCVGVAETRDDKTAGGQLPVNASENINANTNIKTRDFRCVEDLLIANISYPTTGDG
jgi:hypothetical protein